MKTFKLFFISLCLLILAGPAYAGNDAGHHPIDVPFGVHGGLDRPAAPDYDVLDEMSWDKQEALNPSREPVSHQHGGGRGVGSHSKHKHGGGRGFGFPPPYGLGFPAPYGLGFPAPYGLGFPAPYGLGFPAPYGLGFPAPYGLGFPAPYGLGFPAPYGLGFPPFSSSWGVGAAPNAAMMSPQIVHCTFGKEHLLASSVESCENAGGKVKPAPATPSEQ